MSSLGGSSSSGNRSPDRGDRLEGLVDRQRGLREPGDAGRVADDDAGHVGRALHQLDVVGGLARRTLDLLVAGVADQQDVVVLRGEAHGLVVDLGHQRAGRVDRLQRAHLGLAVHLRRDAVGGEDHGLTGRDLVELLDEDRAARLEVGDDVLVVDDLLADVDRGAVEVERLLDRDDGAVDTGAVAPWRRQQHGLLGRLRRQDRRHAHVGGHGAQSRADLRIPQPRDGCRVRSSHHGREDLP